MSLAFTSDARPPSNIRLLPGEFLRPDFGALYGFDSSGPGGGGSTPPADETLQATYDTQANIEARTGDPVGTIYFSSDSDRIYVYDGTNWQYYNHTTFQSYYDTQANIEARSGDPVGTTYMASDVVRLYVYDGTNWQYYTGV